MSIVKRLLILFAATVFVFGVFSISHGTIRADGDIEINETNFPDAQFRAWLLEQSYGQDGVLSPDEISGVTSINVRGKEITSLEGIEFFKSLEKLDCSYNYISNLDMSSNLKLVELNCSSSRIETLNVNGCSNLVMLDVGDGYDDIFDNPIPLRSLDLSTCTNLTELDMSSTRIEEMDLGNCVDLQILNASYNGKLKNLDVSKNTNLRKLYLYGSSLKSIDLSNCLLLEVLYCASSLKSLDVSNHKLLTDLTIGRGGGDPDDSCLLEKLDISGCTSIKEISTQNAWLTDVNAAGCTSLTLMDITYSAVEQLNLCGCDSLERLDCCACKINSIDLSGCISLQHLNCQTNQLTELDIKDCENLKTLFCGENQIETLDISSNPYLVLAHDKGEYSEKIYGISYRDWTYEENGEKYVLSVDEKTNVSTDGIYIDPDIIKLNKKSATIVCGKTITLKATTDGTSSKVTWKSSNEKIATVNSSGKVTAKQAGTVVVSAYVDKAVANCTITVLYKDVTNTKDFWYAPTNYLTAKGVVKGYDKQTKFKPGNDCTRAQMVTFLWRLQGEPVPKSSTCKFKDVKSSDYFYKPVIWAVEKGITTGVSKTKFNPQGVCTRAQTVTFLWRMAEKPDPTISKNKFKDVKKKDYFYKAVLWASELKIVAGYKDGTFKPQGKCLRRQMVTFLYKYDKFVNGKG